MYIQKHPFESGQDISTLMEMLCWRAQKQPQQQAYIFLKDGESTEESLTYAALDKHARAISALLQTKQIVPGVRALLLYPPGLEYIAAFFGCLYSGVIAVPVYPPLRNKRSFQRLLAIALDCQASIVLTSSHFLEQEGRQFKADMNLSGMKWLATDQDGMVEQLAGSWQVPDLDASSPALLQYTSGSTATPKGVLISHKNLMQNLTVIQHCCEHGAQSHGVTWAPPYHDMGLVGGILQPVYGGFPVTFMSPLAFLQRPIRWLQALSRTHGTTSGGPNFAYDLCTRKISREECIAQSIDLSNWSLAFCSAEPVHHTTLERFVQTFEPFGFRREAFYPCYGLAEATLLVTGGSKRATPIMRSFDRAALVRNEAKPAEGEQVDKTNTLVSSGRPLPNYQLMIVNPETTMACPSGHIGEIWIAGPCVAQGYWRQPEETERSFQAQIADVQTEEYFLRSGDLGFLYEGELFVTGRLKDLIIIRGRNYYPQDIELAAMQSHPAFISGTGAAFSIDVSGEERLVVVHEIGRHFAHQEKVPIINALRRAVTEEFGLQVYAVALLKTASIPKTTSGKVQRYACKKGFLEDTLDILTQNILAGSASEFDVDAIEQSGQKSQALPFIAPDEQGTLLETFLRREVAHLLGHAPAEIGLAQSLNELGLDSLNAIELENIVERHCGVVLPLSRILQGISIAEIVREIHAQLSIASSHQQISVQVSTSEENAFSLSYGQEALWFVQQVAPEEAVYNLARAIRIQGPLNLTALQSVLQVLVARHSALRTIFSFVDGVPLQKVLRSPRIDFEHEDISFWENAQLQHKLRTEAWRPFHLTEDIPWRMRLFTLSAQEHVLLFVVHHIIADFWSMAILLDEFCKLYQAEVGSSPLELSSGEIEYSDYVRWQRSLLNSTEMEKHWRYWQEQLAGTLPILKLPIERHRPARSSFVGATYSFEIATQLTQQVKNLAQAERVTLYMLLLAVFQILLYRYTGQEDILVGSPTSGRHRAPLASLVGYLVNPIVLRTRLTGESSFQDVLRQVRDTVLAAFEHQDIPFPLLVQRLRPTRDPSYSPLFQTMFVLQKAQRRDIQAITSLALGQAYQPLKVADLLLSSYPLEQTFTEFDLLLTIAEGQQKTFATFQYNTNLYETSSVSRMAIHFQTLLENIVSQPEQRLSEISLLTTDERYLILQEWNATRVDLPLQSCVHELFESQVQQTPEKIAVVYGQQSLTYHELNQRANQLARYLRKQGVITDTAVGLYLERSLELIVGVLGILKAGGTYIPLDPTYPQERLTSMLDNLSLLVTRKPLMSMLSHLDRGSVFLDTDWPQIAVEDTANLTQKAAVQSLMYIIYTSGSTGQPKGAGIYQHSFINLLKWFIHEFSMTSQDKVLLITSLSFDLTQKNIFAPLIVGGTLHMLNVEHFDPFVIAEIIAHNHITLLNCTPSSFYPLVAEPNLLPKLAPLRYLFLGGEPIAIQQLTAWLQSPHFHAEIVNTYGPTECTDIAAFHRLTPITDYTNSRAVIPIGKPISNVQLVILDNYKQLLPIGIIGELYIAGLSLGAGYINDQISTAENFVRNPFPELQSAQLYKTGDLARYAPNGSIEFLGRSDNQIKIRGFRVELEEIIGALRLYPDIQDAAIISKQDSTGMLSLHAYLVCQREIPLSLQEVRTFLRRIFPDFMIPATFHCVAILPLTPNGKVDYSTLQAMDVVHLGSKQGMVTPRSSLERVIAGVWADALNMDQIGIFDDFFELGGHSLLAIRIISRLRTIFSLEIPLVALFQSTTVATLAEYIEYAGHTASIDIAEIAELLLYLNALPDTDIHAALQQYLPEENSM